MAKLSEKYNVFGLAISVGKDENCKLLNSAYSKKGKKSYTTLQLPQTVLTVGEYIDIMSRL